jgi:2-polyprenyl-3-methyl-5-hydroxy-6-metoxy-1,4-benzoquinol methylase
MKIPGKSRHILLRTAMPSTPSSLPAGAGGNPHHIYADYTEKPDLSHRPMYLAATLEFLRELPRGAAFLDAGCGGGDFSIGLAEAGRNILDWDYFRGCILVG